MASPDTFHYMASPDTFHYMASPDTFHYRASAEKHGEKTIESLRFLAISTDNKNERREP